MSEEVNIMNGAEAAEVSDLGEKYLTFNIDGAIYGITIENVIEIIGVEKTTEVPGIPRYIKGIINLRGKVVPVIDARLKIGAAEKEYDELTCIIVITWRDAEIGLIVDSVAEVADLSSREHANLPDFSNINTNKYLSSVCRVGEKLILLFDCDKLLADESEIAAMI